MQYYRAYLKSKQVYLRLLAVIIACLGFVSCTTSIDQEFIVPTQTITDDYVTRETQHTATMTPEMTKKELIASPTPDNYLNKLIPPPLTINNITVQASNIRRGNEKMSVDFCYTLMDDRDWGIYDAVLQYNQTESHYLRSILIEPVIPAENGKTGRRCDTLEFKVSAQAKLTDFYVSILSFAATPREGMNCNLIKSIQQKLDRKKTGIRLACRNENGQVSYDIVTIPTSINQEEAQKMVYNEVISLTEGPWEFRVTLK